MADKPFYNEIIQDLRELNSWSDSIPDNLLSFGHYKVRGGAFFSPLFTYCSLLESAKSLSEPLIKRYHQLKDNFIQSKEMSEGHHRTSPEQVQAATSLINDIVSELEKKI